MKLLLLSLICSSLLLISAEQQGKPEAEAFNHESEAVKQVLKGASQPAKEKITESALKPEGEKKKFNNSSTTTTASPPVTVTVLPIPPTTASPHSERKPGNWSFTEKGNKTCIRLVACIDIDVPNLAKNSSGETIHLTVPNNATVVGGHCADQNESEEMIDLKWKLSTNATAFLNLTFVKDNSSLVKLHQIYIKLEAYNSTFPQIANRTVIELNGQNFSAFSVPQGSSYSCAKESKLSLTEKKSNKTGTITFEHLQLQAFKENDSKDFDDAQDCEVYITPDIVPIIVGCTLALLVIVVLVAYLITRRRQQARGYLSM